MRLKEKTAIVTGASTGIGKAISILFAREGARIVAADLSDDQGREVVAQIRSEGNEATYLHADVSNAADAEALVQSAVGTYGKLDVLVNNAAAYVGDGNILSIPDDLWDRIIDVDLKGVYLCTKKAIPAMIDNHGGSIIHISSVNALVGLSLTAYSSAKGGIISFSRVIAIDFGKYGIRSNVVCPGTILTENSGKIYAERLGLEDRVRKLYPIGRLGEPQDVSYCALYLASDESTFVTGSTMVVDGGLTAGAKFELEYAKEPERT
jgi:3-oxoacyl-[acyl-carrier protein] reductase